MSRVRNGAEMLSQSTGPALEDCSGRAPGHCVSSLRISTPQITCEKLQLGESNPTEHKRDGEITRSYQRTRSSCGRSDCTLERSFPGSPLYWTVIRTYAENVLCASTLWLLLRTLTPISQRTVTDHSASCRMKINNLNNLQKEKGDNPRIHTHTYTQTQNQS